MDNQKILRRTGKICGGFLTVLFHTFDHLQTCKLFTLFFFQSIGDISGESFVSGDGDVFQRIGTLLGFFDVGGKTDGGVFDHGELDGQLLYTLEGCLGLVQGQLGAVVGIGRRVACFLSYSTRGISVPMTLLVLIRMESSTGTV